jgi:hypothetical protein
MEELTTRKVQKKIVVEFYKNKLYLLQVTAPATGLQIQCSFLHSPLLL